MFKKPVTKALVFGILSWLLPLIFSIFFYGKNGELQIDEMLFKSLLVVFGSVVGVLLLVKYFAPLTTNFMKHAVWIGLGWLALNVVLDVLILVPWLDLSYSDYTAEIGLRYLTIPIMSIGFGYLLTQHRTD